MIKEFNIKKIDEEYFCELLLLQFFDYETKKIYRK